MATSKYRPSKEQSFRLRETTCVYLEHRQYTEGFELLSNIITCGQSRGEDQPHTLLPLTEQLCLAATLSVHPKFTSRANSSEERQASDEALRFLYHVLESVGPVSADFSKAFLCRPPNSRQDQRKHHSELQNSQSDEDTNVLNSVFAHEKSLFAHVNDIWQIVGWAFNCSNVWRIRWESWSLFLDFYLSLLEADLDERIAMDQNEGSDECVGESLAVHALASAGGRTGRRRVMKAIMADGNEKSLKEFPEVFKNETKGKKTSRRESKRTKLDIEGDKWGDYDMEEDEEAVVDRSEDDDESDEETSEPCDLDALRLRARFFVVMARVAELCPQEFVRLEELFDVFSEFMKPLQIEVFKQLLLQMQLPPKLQAAFLSNIALPFLTSIPSKLDILNLDHEDLVEYFLPARANSMIATENAKYSFILECLLANFFDRGLLVYSTSFQIAIQSGISLRLQHAIGDGRRKSKGSSLDGGNGRSELKWSGERIKYFLQLSKASSRPSRHLDRSLSSSSLSPAPSSSKQSF